MKKLEKVNVVLKKDVVLEYDEQITRKDDIIDFIIKHEDLDIKAEMECYAIYLNVKNQILGYSLISKGGDIEAIVDLRTIFKRALLLNAQKMIILKNNPSGNDGFSSFDRELKDRLENAGEIMNIRLVDFITTEKRYTSLFSNR